MSTLCNATYEDLRDFGLGMYDVCRDPTCGQTVNRHRAASGMFCSNDSTPLCPCLSIHFPLYTIHYVSISRISHSFLSPIPTPLPSHPIPSFSSHRRTVPMYRSRPFPQRQRQRQQVRNVFDLPAGSKYLLVTILACHFMSTP